MNVPPSVLSILSSGPVLQPGHVWLVGAGPGDPSQLTLEAVSALCQAEVVVHDALVDARVLELAPASAQRLFAGKRGGKPSAIQADISAQLVTLAQQGRRVVRLKGGDPYVFGRGGEEVLTLAEAGVPFRVVPGLTSGLAALTAAAMPATMRGINQAIVLVTGHGADTVNAPNWKRLAELGEPLVLYMAMTHLAAISQALIAGGLPPHTLAAVIAAVATPEERVLVSTLADVACAADEARIGAPAIVVIGEIVSTRARLAAAAQKDARR
jgi:uroporphyrin-III C-methyltransferase